MTDDLDAVRSLAADLGLDVTDETAAQVLEGASPLGDVANSLREPVAERESAGSRRDDPYNAFLDVYDEPRAAGRGPLAGTTVAVKDNIAVRDLRMTCGLRGWSHVPSFDATAVERLLDAGASLVGKTNMDAMALGPGGERSEFGDIRNPAAEGRVPGGSSGGSAAAVAAGLVDVALGSDTGGSVRGPASHCGVVGIKPSHGIVPLFGFVHAAPSTDVVGPLARDVGTAARALAAMAGPDPRDPTATAADIGDLVPGEPSTDLVVGLPVDLLSAADPEVEAVIRETAADLRAAGAETREVPLDVENTRGAYALVAGAEFASLLRRGMVVYGKGTSYDEEWRAAMAGLAASGLNEHVAGRILPGALVDARTDGESYVAARRTAIEFVGRLEDRFESVDLLLAPTHESPPPEFGERDGDAASYLPSAHRVPFALAGVPGVSVPAGEIDGLPVGAQVIGPKYGDAAAIEGARLVERARAGATGL